MKKRILFTAVTVLVLLGAVAFVKVRQIQTAIAQGMSYQPPPEAITTVVAEREQWPGILSAIGTVEAVHGVEVSADLPGIVRKIAFQSGGRARTGDPLVLLDTRQEEAQLAAAEAQRNLAVLNYERIRELREKKVAAQAEYDRADAERKEAEARVGEIRATIDRKTIRAPFDGILGIRRVNLGQYLNDGEPIAPLQSLDPIYVNFSVPQQEVSRLRLGDEVELSIDGLADLEVRGKITAINSVVDEATRNVQIQASFRNPEGKMRPGMFVTARVLLGPGDPMVALPASAISHAPYGDSIFIVETMKGGNGQEYLGVRQQFIKLGASRGDQVSVLSGIDPGEEVATSGVFKLRNGAAVLVNNEVQPSNDPAPRPEDS